MSLPALLLLTLLPQLPRQHAVAIINDARSHGVVGDGLLSLDETIRLANFELAQSQLSAAERAQILGVGEPSTVEIDAALVPVLRVERELTEIADRIDGFFLEGLNGVATIDFGATRGLRTRGSFQGFRRLRLLGGDVAIDSLQDSAYHTSLVEEITCEGQRVAGMRFLSRGTAPFWRLILEDCRFVEVPQGLLLTDAATGATTQLDLGRVTSLRGGGIDLTLGSGGSLLVTLLRVACEAAPIRILRPGPGADQALRLVGTHVRADRLEVDGHQSGPSAVELHSVDLMGPGAALRLGAAGARFLAELTDLHVRGDVTIAGLPGAALQVHNGRFDAGQITLGLDARFERSRFASAAVRATAAVSAFVGCDFLGGSLVPAGGALTLSQCHLDGVRRDAQVQSQMPRAEAWHGAFDVLPTLPRLGGVVELRHDLPQGRSGLWLFGQTSDLPLVGPDQARLYLTANSLVVAPQLLRGSGRRRVPIPLDAALHSLDLFVQGVVLADPGVPGPALLMPPGARVTFP